MKMHDKINENSIALVLVVVPLVKKSHVRVVDNVSKKDVLLTKVYHGALNVHNFHAVK